MEDVAKSHAEVMGRISERDAAKAEMDALHMDERNLKSRYRRLQGRRRLAFMLRRLADKGLTRFGMYVNTVISSFAIVLIAASVLGFGWKWRLFTAFTSAGVTAWSGLILFRPPLITLVSSARKAKRELAQIGILKCEVERRLQAAQASVDAAQKRYGHFHSIATSRLNRLRQCQWQYMTGVPFENFLADVFREWGYTVETTKVTGDQGVDLIVSKDGRRVAVQAKGYPSTTVGNKAVQEAHTGMTFYGCHAAAVITNSTYTAAAIELAERVKCTLIDGRQIPYLIEGRIRV